MEEVFVDEFCGHKVLTTIWRGKPCWLAVQVATIIGYEEASKGIAYCLKVEEFEVGIEHDVLSGDDLKGFKSILKRYDVDFLKYTPKVVIFYEDGLFGFLQFSHKPIGAKFRKWIRKEVKPKLKKILGFNDSNEKKGLETIADKNTNLDSFKEVGLTHLNYQGENNEFDIDKFQRLRLATESAKMIKGLLDDVDTDSICKLAVIKALFLESGINLPIYFNKKD